MAILLRRKLHLLEGEGENTNIIKLLLSTPKVFNIYEDTNAVEVANYLLPRSVGIEVECLKGDDFNLKAFEDIPNILDVNVDNNEQRYRIPTGLLGLQCMYDICKQLKLNSLSNPNSGIHYHIDCTNFFDDITSSLLKDEEDWILQELDTWDYGGKYNVKKVYYDGGACWVRFQKQFKTMEIRIGNMTFNYGVIIRNAIHGCHIAEKLAERVGIRKKEDFPILNYEEKDLRSFLKNRIIKQ